MYLRYLHKIKLVILLFKYNFFYYNWNWAVDTLAVENSLTFYFIRIYHWKCFCLYWKIYLTQNYFWSQRNLLSYWEQSKYVKREWWYVVWLHILLLKKLFVEKSCIHVQENKKKNIVFISRPFHHTYNTKVWNIIKQSF